MKTLPIDTFYYGKVTMKENRNGIKEVRWVTNSPNNASSKREASQFISEEELRQAYQTHFDTNNVESFEVKTNHSPYTNSVIG